MFNDTMPGRAHLGICLGGTWYNPDSETVVFSLIKHGLDAQQKSRSLKKVSKNTSEPVIPARKFDPEGSDALPAATDVPLYALMIRRLCYDS